MDALFAAYGVTVKAAMGEMKVVKLLFLPLCVDLNIIMRPSSLGGGRILRRTLSVCLSVRPSRYRCHW